MLMSQKVVWVFSIPFNCCFLLVWWWHCGFSATVIDSCQWVTSEIPMIIQLSVYNIAAFIIFCWKSVCHTNGIDNDFVSCFMLSWYQLNISCMCFKTFVRRQWKAFIGKTMAGRFDDVQWRQLHLWQSRRDHKTRRTGDMTTFLHQINLWMRTTAMI